MSKISETSDVINVNNVVDKLASVTDTSNFKQTPQDKIEFIVAVKQLIDDVPIDNIPNIYKLIKDVIDTSSEKTTMSNKKIEESVRAVVRKLIAEAQPLPPVKKIPFGVHGAEYERNMAASRASLNKAMKKDLDADLKKVTVDDVEEPEVKKRAQKATSLGNMLGVGGASFEDIAKELNFSVAGAKQAVDKALEKTRWLTSEIDEDDLEIIVLNSMNNYIEDLAGTGELTDEEVKMMKDHPAIVRELDGFREYLGNVLRRVRKEYSGAVKEHTNRVNEALASVGIKL